MANDLHRLIAEFAGRLAAIIESEVLEKARRGVLAAFGVGVPRPVGRPPKAQRSGVATTARRKPLQLCPVPGCSTRAAPIFGMVCAKHKDVPKAKITAYREARRAKNAKGATGASIKKRGRKRGRPRAISTMPADPATA